MTRTPLQSVIDPFVRSAGGELIAEVIDQHPEQAPTQADYFFRSERVIVELKALETPSFGESYGRTLSELASSWVEKGLLLVYGTARIDLQRLHPICQDEWVGVLAGPLQRNVIAKANRQIAETKTLLRVPDAKGLLWLASDGNIDLQPTDVWFLVSRVLRKTTPDGQKQYSNIDAVAYFHPRTPVTVPSFPGDVFLWLGDSRENDPRLRDFIHHLRSQWISYSSAVTGLKIIPVEGGPAFSTARFAGSVQKIPRVSLSQSKKS